MATVENTPVLPESKKIDPLSYKSQSLFVTDIPKELDDLENTLGAIFTQSGVVTSIKVCRDYTTHRSLGYAYVNFNSVDEAENAIKQNNFYQILPGRQIRVMFSMRDPAIRKKANGNLFIKNIDPSIDNQTLHNTFSKFGSILSCKVSQNEDGKSNEYGFVHFHNEQDANEVIKLSDELKVGDRTVTIIPYIKKQDRDEQESKVFVNIFVKNIKNDTTEDDVKKVFDEFQDGVESLYLSNVSEYNSKFALITMKTHEGAKEAIEKLHDDVHTLTSNENKLYVARAMKKKDRQISKNLISNSVFLQTLGRNIYVKHIDESITSTDFTELFAGFGEITSSRLMTDNSGVQLGFGFICFQTKEAAQNAIQNMNGKVIGNRPLFVVLAQKKDTRSKYLVEQRKMYFERSKMPHGPQDFTNYWNTAPHGRDMMNMPGMGQGSYVLPQRGGLNVMGRGGFHPLGPQNMIPPNRGGARFPQGGKPPYNSPVLQNGKIPHGRVPQGAINPMHMRVQQNMHMPIPGNMPHPEHMMKPIMDNQQGKPVNTNALLSTGNPQTVVNTKSIDEILKMPLETQKNEFGEQIYAQAVQFYYTKAPKITGMILEMPISELIQIIQNKDLLITKIHEAFAVLQKYDKQ